jgi:hypothetical protein
MRDIVAYAATATTRTDASSEDEFALNSDEVAFDDEDPFADSDFFNPFRNVDRAALAPIERAINDDTRFAVADDGDEFFVIGASLTVGELWVEARYDLCDAEGLSGVQRCRTGEAPTSQWKEVFEPRHIAPDSVTVGSMPLGAAMGYACKDDTECITSEDGRQMQRSWLPCSDAPTCERLAANFKAFLRLFDTQ